MTLLEALVALVILGLSAIGYLEVFQRSARGTRAAAEWEHAVAIGEAAMERSRLDGVTPDDSTTTVSTRPWRGRVDEMMVTVRLPDGGVLSLSRLVRRK
jgi:Tfp pilus assembly protein PilV